MELNPDACYQALVAHDPRFDGVFFVGVSTTKIYCRTVCPAKTPGRDRCTFYPSAAAAERAGYRPCLRCRPELAPGNARMDGIGRLAAAAADRIEEGALTEGSVADLAVELGVSERHLRRVVGSEFGVSPVELAQTQRLLLAKRLLADTRLPVGEVAFAAGFSSLRRFNALVQERYRLSPTQIRGQRKIEQPGGQPESLRCELSYRPPLDWHAVIAFLGPRCAAGVEAVDHNRYLRTVAIGRSKGWIAVEPVANKNRLRIDIWATLLPSILPVLTRVKRLFDLSADPHRIASHLGTLAVDSPGMRVPGAFDGYELAVRAILGQQVSVKAATTLADRFVKAFGDEAVDIDVPTLTHYTPNPERVAAASVDELTALGILPARARSILALSTAVAAGEITLEPSANVDDTIAKLVKLPGIGDWTAQYIAMRALSWPDAFPHTDLAIYKALGETNPRRVLETAEAWRPWRSYATMHLWHTGPK